MTKLDDYFSEDMADDERLSNYQAFTNGAILGLGFFVNRLASYYDLLELELEDNPAAEAYLNDCLKAIHQINRMIASHQSVMKIDWSSFESLDLLVLIQGITARLEKVGKSKISLESHCEEGESFTKGQFFQLQNAFFELIRSFGENEKINFYLNRQQLDDDYFNSRTSQAKGGDYFIFSLSQDTKGFNADDYVCYTDYLISSESVLDEQLIFVYGVVLEHGGEILTRKYQDGLESLAILLPTIQNKVNMFGDNVSEELLKGNETVLLVDDEDIIWDVVIDMLQRLGYTVILAENGLDCVEIYRENPGQIDLILLDMVMPEMNGRECYFELQKMDPDVKVILQSGYIAQADAQDVLDAGAKGFLQKPYRMTDLAQKIREIFN